MTKRIYIGLVFILVVLVCVFVINKRQDLTPPKNLVVVAFGDSLVAGQGSTSGNDFISLLSKEIGINIINKGQNGDTTESALVRIDDILALDPGVVVLLLGGNDYLRRVPEEATFKNLDKIITRFKENNTKVVLLGVRGGLLKDNYEESFADLANTHDLFYVPNVLKGLLGKQDLMSDQVHPNDKGYRIIADKVLPVVKKALQL